MKSQGHFTVQLISCISEAAVFCNDALKQWFPFSPANYATRGTVAEWLKVSPHSQKVTGLIPEQCGAFCVESACCPCVRVESKAQASFWDLVAFNVSMPINLFGPTMNRNKDTTRSKQTKPAVEVKSVICCTYQVIL